MRTVARSGSGQRCGPVLKKGGVTVIERLVRCFNVFFAGCGE